MREFIWEVTQKTEAKEGNKVYVIKLIILVGAYGLMFLGHSEKL